jgi:hypothetical protein
MDHVTSLITKYFDVSDDGLIVGGVPIRDIVARYGTPVFVYDRSIVDR